jgi:hypothetical protein
MAETSPETAQLVDALLTCTASMTLIIDHMSRAPGASTTSVVDTLRTLLSDVLSPLEKANAPAELAGAARVIDAAADRIGGDLYLVPHGPPPTHRRRPRRPCA